ncbi:MAG: hypothetical protein LAP87_00870 [Acidobacteriia bacterium]|nr:hypothetical protein [Terriglobia bacterium]
MRQTVTGVAGRTALLLLFTAAWIPAAVRVSLPSQPAAPGSSVVIPVTCSSQDGSASGIQFDLLYDSAAVSIGVTVGDAPRGAGKRLYLADVASGQKRFLIIGLNQDSIPDGALVNLLVHVDSNGASGEYPLTISSVVGTDANGQPVAVVGTGGTLIVQGAAGSGERLSAMGVLNGASLLPGPVAAGEIVTLSGAGIGVAQQPDGSTTLASLGEVSVIFDGVPSPILYATANQINLVVPYAVYSKPETQLQVVHQDEIVAALSVSVADAAPAVFTLDASGVGPGAILNQDGTLNTPSNPAEKNSVVVLFATGAGQTDPPGTDGKITAGVSPNPLLPVSVQIDNLDAQVLATPTIAAGVLQVSCIVPAHARSGYTVPVVLAVGNAASPAGVTLAIK